MIHIYSRRYQNIFQKLLRIEFQSFKVKRDKNTLCFYRVEDESVRMIRLTWIKQEKKVICLDEPDEWDDGDGGDGDLDKGDRS